MSFAQCILNYGEGMPPNLEKRNMNTKQQGDIGVAKAIYYYTVSGFIVSIPNTDNSRYDLVVDKGVGLQKVQVKTTTFKSKYGVYEVGLKTCGGNSSWSGVSKKLSKEEIDTLFVLTQDGDMYEFPPEVFDGRGRLNLGKDRDIYKVGLNRW